MNKKEAIKEAKVAANWVKNNFTVTFVSLCKKVYNSDGWLYNYTWNISKDFKWVPINLDAFYEELGITAWTDGSYDLGEVLNRNGYAVKDSGASVIVFGTDVKDIIERAAKTKNNAIGA